MHILALQPNLMSRSAGYATEHDGKIVTTTMHPRWETSPVIRS
jgi:hypothetical protein